MSAGLVRVAAVVAGVAVIAAAVVVGWRMLAALGVLLVLGGIAGPDRWGHYRGGDW